MAGQLFRASVFGFFLLLCPIVSHNASGDRRDGNWWRDHTTSEKTNYIVWFFDGMDLGYNFSYWGIMDENKDDPTISRISASYHGYGTKYMNHVTNFQLVDGLDSFYSDYRNRRIRASDAVWLVLNEISGKPRAEMDKMIENWRKNAASPE